MNELKYLSTLPTALNQHDQSIIVTKENQKLME